MVFIGGPGTGKTHLAIALGVAGITHHGKRVRFFSTVDLVNALEREKAEGKAGRIAFNLMRVDLVILRRARLPALQPSRRRAAVPPALQALRAHQRDDHHQSELRRVGERVRRREDDHRAARPAHASLPHRGDRQRVLPLPTQQHHGQVAHQVARAAKRRRTAPKHAARGAAGYAPRVPPGYPCGLPRANRFTAISNHRSGAYTTTENRYTYPQPTPRSASHPWSKFNRHGWSKFNRRRQRIARAIEEPRGDVDADFWALALGQAGLRVCRIPPTFAPD